MKTVLAHLTPEEWYQICVDKTKVKVLENRPDVFSKEEALELYTKELLHTQLIYQTHEAEIGGADYYIDLVTGEIIKDDE